MSKVHLYRTECRWEGSTGVGYEAYDRTHTVAAAPSPTSLTLSSDPAFRGRAELLNPEQLIVMAASSCQLLSFLAACARARIDVRQYTDQAEAVMPEDDPPMRITSILLRPRITIASGPTEARIRGLVETAHKECFIASSLRSEVRVEPVITFV